MVFYIYKIKNINYIGSAVNIKNRTINHKTICWNKNSKNHNLLVYQYIREKQIEIELEILFCYKKECSNRLQRLVEQYYINKYNSINDGLNTRNAFLNIKKYFKKYYQENKENLKKYCEKNKENYEKYKKKYCEKNKEYYKKYSKKYREKNKEKIKEIHKKHYQTNKEKLKQKAKLYYEENKKTINQKLKQKINCPICKCSITKCNLKRHQKSKKCLKVKNSNISQNEIDFKYNQTAYNEHGEFMNWY